MSIRSDEVCYLVKVADRKVIIFNKFGCGFIRVLRKIVG